LSIALDGMGGDHAPREIVLGALLAAPHIHSKILLVGKEELMHGLLPKPIPSNIEIIGATEHVDMHEKPTEAIRKKKDSSLAVAVRLVKEGKAKAMVSAGNTGAATASSLLSWRQIEGIHRPAIATVLPNNHNGFLLLDSGASPDVDPEHIVEFAVMGRAYAQKVMGRKSPRVHLLNIGEEPGKGNAFAKTCYELLAKYPWFKGNIEGNEMYHGDMDVVVCEAFVGNIVLKTSEGIAEMFALSIKNRVPTNPLLKLPFWPVSYVTGPLKQKMDYAEVGGSPLLGLNGVCVISHGRSSAKAIKNALLMAQKAVEADLVDTIRESMKKTEVEGG
jgi:glycerol-3-phosphate acyltransferase PlsX